MFEMICKFLLNCEINSVIVNKLFLHFSKCVKKMFLSITDSVMISHIYLIDFLLRLRVSVEGSF